MTSARTRVAPEILEGTRDLLPGDMAKIRWTLDRLTGVFARFGYDPIETPSLEYAKTLQGSYGGESRGHLYQFEDPSGRRVALRYDQTVPFARLVASAYRRLPMPFKRYQIGRVWRAERPVKGRLREFTQCDVDIIGTDGFLAEGEVAELVCRAFEALGGVEYLIRVNSRRPGTGAPEQVREFFRWVRLLRLPEERFQYDPRLSEGLGYYTGLVFKVYIKGFREAVCTGGRYDHLCERFSDRRFSGVGVAFGIERLLAALEASGRLGEAGLHTDALVVYDGEATLPESLEAARDLRAAGVNTEHYVQPDPLARQLKYADRKAIPFVVYCGPEETARREVTIQVRATGKKKSIPRAQLTSYLNGFLS